MIKILLIEDDVRVASFIEKGLIENLFQVKVVSEGFTGVKEAMANNYDLIILDVMLPGMEGFEVCKLLRKRKIIIPIIFLSALDSPEEKVRGLKCGADDYLSKPFLFDELLARIQAQIRRIEFSKGVVEFQKYGGVTINMDEQSAMRDEQSLELSQLEFKLLVFLMKNREKAISRIAIAQSVWNIQFDYTTNTVDVYINFLRKKLDKGFAKPLIHTIKGTGYMLKEK
ncbi:response regulator transcription factor [Pedobacter sp. ASV28]|uniref:response regulator transcription factor n=1 Tax=Pedobacter sp. ASV28 TaxID=2795123 RepID=UPI0018EDC650|nr:response regulator transcription factor [Pedobacter sp. ASV28]